MGFFDDINIDRDHFIEGCIVVGVAILVIIFIYVMCCHAKKKAEQRRKREEEEEATSFFTLDDGPLDTPASRGRGGTSYKSTVFSLAETPMCPPQTYITIAQAPVTMDQLSCDTSPGPILLGPGKGQHVSTPIYPPSYFSPSAGYDVAPPAYPASAGTPYP